MLLISYEFLLEKFVKDGVYFLGCFHVEGFGKYGVIIGIMELA